MLHRISPFIQNKLITDFKHILNNIYAYNLLNNYLNNYSYLPISNSSLDFYTIAMIANEIIINQRKNIIEFGSGISSIILARLIKKEKLDTKIYTIDDNLDWIKVLKQTTEKENLQEIITFIFAKSDSCKLSLNNLNWYHSKSIDNVINTKLFDLVIIDGPMAYRKEIEFSRYPAMLYMQNKLLENYTVFLDDIDRKGEKKIMKMWEKKFGIKFNILTKKLAFASKGNWYNTII